MFSRLRITVVRSAALTCASVAACALVAPPASAAASAAGAAAAGQPGVSRPVVQPDGTVTGMVRSVAGAGLTGICVTALGRSAGQPAAHPAITRTGGRYLIAGLPAGQYTISYQACGQPGAYVSQFYGGAMLASRATRITVVPGQISSLRPVTLLPASRAALVAATAALARRSGPEAKKVKPAISGTVRDSHGKPLAGICVDANLQQGDSATGIGGIRTRKDGSYGIPGKFLQAGGWTVEFTTGCGSKANFAPQWWKFTSRENKATKVRVGKGSHVTGIDAKLVPGAALSGTVRAGSESGKGLPGVCVEVFGADSNFDVFQQAITGAGGKYLITGLGTGRYDVQFQPGCGSKGDYTGTSYPKAVAVTDGKTTKGIDAVLTLAGRIAGTVTASAGGAPVAGICVQAEGTGSTGGFAAVKTRVDGSYVLNGLPAGAYQVSFTGGCGNAGSFAPQFYNGQASPLTAGSVKVAAGVHVAGIDAAMAPGGTITGQVTSTSGKKLSGICVLAAPAANQLAAGLLGQALNDIGLLLGSGAVAHSGAYHLANLQPGNYSISFSSGCGRAGAGFGAQWFSPQGGDRQSLVFAGTRPVHGVDAKLAAEGSISGVIRNSAGKAVRGVCAVSVGLAGEPESLEVLGGDNPSSVSNKHGAYRLTGLAAGKYAIEFSPCGASRYAVGWYKQAASEAAAHPVTVRTGRTVTGIDQTMTSGSAISGQITSAATRKSLRRICVLAFDSDGNLVNEISQTQSGHYSIPHLAPDSYSVEFLSCEDSLLEVAVLGSEIQASAESKVASVLKSKVRVRGSVPTRLNVALPASGSLAGQVLAGSPAAPAGGTCAIATPVTGAGVPGLAFTGSGGRYLLSGLAPGKYQVEFSSLCAFGSGGLVPQWFDGQPSQSAATPVTVPLGGAVTGIGATLAADGGISGTVLVSGSPVAGVCVLAYPRSGSGAPEVSETDAAGGYQLGDLVPGGYVVEFTSGCGVASYHTQWYNGAASRAKATKVTVSADSVTTMINAH